ncbi:hypothetical protein M413DRAFT_443001 [Hebeloma cylindrosporum]|uniref:F-box domain-containing protein n=1 Tax=Hebeloma cylindrosporum TaxID=76867 RepID=A0A0C2YSB5_HEBCY|nr:hypothetical protein M413DRAFT_443001 [Hebeloma cylindrosporum h7]
MGVHPDTNIEGVPYSSSRPGTVDDSLSPPTTGLLDLPTEILLHIFQDSMIKPVDLYSLAILSKRLNMIAIPLFLDAKSITRPEDTLTLIFDDSSQPSHHHFFKRSRPTSRFDDTNERDDLDPLGPEAGIMVAFHITSVREMRCTFPHLFSDITTLLRHLNRLDMFLLRLTSVKSLTMHFEGDHRYRHSTLNAWSTVPFQFSVIMGNICRSLEARGCETFLIYNRSHHFQYWKPEVYSREMAEHNAFTFLPQSPSSEELYRAKEKLGIKISHLREGLHIPPKLPPKDPHTTYGFFDPSSVSSGISSLRTLHIQTPFLLLPRCFPHVRGLIHASKDTLTSLSFSHILFDDRLIHSCLTALCLDRPNSITHLSITRCRRIPNLTLLTFLRCFRDRLEHLELDKESTCMMSGDDLHLPFVHLNELRILKAPLDWVQYFLQGDSWQFGDNETTHGPPLSHLSSVTIQCRAAEATFFEYRAFYPLLNVILEPLHTRSEAPPHVPSAVQPEVSLDITLHTESWHMDQDRAVFNLLMPAASPQSWSRGRYTPTLHEHPTRPRPPIHWNLISRLNLAPLQPPEDLYQARTLVQWVITLFPGVEEVTFPLPYIRHLMTPAEYRARQLAMLNSAAAYILKAMRERHIDEDSPPVAWRKLVVGQWTFTFDLDTTYGDSFQVASDT